MYIIVNINRLKQYGIKLVFKIYMDKSAQNTF